MSREELSYICLSHQTEKYNHTCSEFKCFSLTKDKLKWLFFTPFKKHLILRRHKLSETYQNHLYFSVNSHLLFCLKLSYSSPTPSLCSAVWPSLAFTCCVLSSLIFLSSELSCDSPVLSIPSAQTAGESELIHQSVHLLGQISMFTDSLEQCYPLELCKPI